MAKYEFKIGAKVKLAKKNKKGISFSFGFFF